MKRPLTSVMATVSALVCCTAGEPQLGAGVRLRAGGEFIDAEVGHLVPTVVDWNGDGKKDLVVGQFGGGEIRLFRNEGTDASPKLGAFARLEAGGKPIRLDAG